MTKLENFQYMVTNIDEFAKWLNENCGDDADWINWFDRNYCKNCESVSIDGSACGDYAYCEVDKKCRFFPEMQEAPNCEEIVKMWLNSEV